MLAMAAFGATVDGHVVNSVTGAGIAGITVSLMRQEHIAYSATTDGQGRFRVEDVNEGAYTATYRLRSAFLVPAICAVAGKLI
jgi:5-hydroxyisourate hydrolase-like protein (transthyretin family)